jgi:hypothetical protein
LRSSGRTGIIASEEEDVPVAVEESYSGNYIVVFDPLDGSSNIDAAVSTGSIFGIYSPNDECLADTSDSDDPTVSDFVNRLFFIMTRNQTRYSEVYNIHTHCLPTTYTRSLVWFVVK